MSQEPQQRIVQLEAELNQANSIAQAAHQTLMETINNGLNMRSSLILLNDKYQTDRQDLSARLAGLQNTINELQKQLVASKEEAAKLHARVANHSEGRTIEGETEKLHLA